MKYRKRSFVIFTVIVGMIAIAVTAVLWNRARLSDEDIALTINSEPVTVQEFLARLHYSHIANTYSYFKSKYEADPNDEFWTKSYGGETPAGYIREETLKDEIRIKVQQMLMKQHGITGDFSYTSFLESWKEENARRKQAVKEGKVIYGPEQFGENEYFDYQFSNNVFKLKETLLSEGSPISEEDLQGKYESDKDTQYRLPDFIRLEKIKAAYGNAGERKEQARQLIESAKKMLDSGMAFEKAAALVNKNGVVEVQIFDDTTARSDSYLYPQLKAAAERLEVGQVSAILETEGEYAIIRCTERVTNRYRSFDEVKDKVRASYMDEQYVKRVDKLVSEAHVQINPDVYGKIIP